MVITHSLIACKICHIWHCTCQPCKGVKMADDKACPQCKGLGEIIFVDSKGNRVPQTCPTCYGSGRVPNRTGHILGIIRTQRERENKSKFSAPELASNSSESPLKVKFRRGPLNTP